MSDSELAGLPPSAKHAFRAVQDGDLATLKRFLGSVDINRARNVSGRTLLHVACLSEDRLVVAELLRAGADPCACDEAHRARLVATLVPKFIRIPADNIPLVVDFWAHVGFY